MSSKVVFSLTEDQASALIMLDDGGELAVSARVESSLELKGLVRRIGQWGGDVELTQSGKHAAALARSIPARG